MIYPFWKKDDKDFSVTYPITEIMRRANKKLQMQDRNIPMTSDSWGMFPTLVGRFRKFSNWNTKGVKLVKVFYDPNYYIRNRQTVELMDPLHTYHVAKYSVFKD